MDKNTILNINIYIFLIFKISKLIKITNKLLIKMEKNIGLICFLIKYLFTKPDKNLLLNNYFNN